MTATGVEHFLHPNRSAMLNQNIAVTSKEYKLCQRNLQSISYDEQELELDLNQKFVQEANWQKLPTGQVKGMKQILFNC